MFEDILDMLNAFTWQQMIWLAVALFFTFVFYKLTSMLIRRVILRADGTEGDVKMIVGVWRFAVSFLAALAILGSYFQLGVITAVIGAFGGMFLGWALQQPVSGFAAWLMVTVKRPFRVGDRVQLPSFGLVGDVKDVGVMYTILDQVGGVL